MIELMIIGNLGKDPEGRYTPAGKFVCNFSVVSHRKVNGEDKFMWVNVTVWEKMGEACYQYLKKGSKVFVRGLPDVDAFIRKSGDAGAALKVTAHTVKFLSEKKMEDGESDIKEGEDILF